MIILRFGVAGRLATICKRALAMVYPNGIFYHYSRGIGFVAESAGEIGAYFNTLEECIGPWRDQKVVVIDSSVDHSTTENLIVHEDYKREVIRRLDQAGLLKKVVGFSSGISMLGIDRIDSSATHMLEYRAQKLHQQSVFANLSCPIYLPNLFTLVGSVTYARQNAAWAQILKARIERSRTVELHEPWSRRAWVSESSVFKSVLAFLTDDAPICVRGALVDGVFTLAEIAEADLLGVPGLAFQRGKKLGWLKGDYLPGQSVDGALPIQDELLRCLCY